MSALMALGCMLQSEDHPFTAVTPATHRRALECLPVDYASVDFGWNRPFNRNDIAPLILHLLEAATPWR